jgi:hypothetical protein
MPQWCDFSHDLHKHIGSSANAASMINGETLPKIRAGCRFREQRRKRPAPSLVMCLWMTCTRLISEEINSRHFH